jgi:hypothetical protein
MLIKARDRENKDGLFDRNIQAGFGSGMTEGRTMRDNVMQGEAQAVAGGAKPHPQPIATAPSASIVTSPVPGTPAPEIKKLQEQLDKKDLPDSERAEIVKKLEAAKAADESSKKRALTVWPDGVDPNDPTKSVRSQSQSYLDPETAERETSKGVGLPRNKDENGQRPMAPVFGQQTAAAQTMGNPNLTPEQRKQQIEQQKQKVDAEAAQLAQLKELAQFKDKIDLARKVAHAIIDAISGTELEATWEKLREIFQELQDAAKTVNPK